MNGEQEYKERMQALDLQLRDMHISTGKLQMQLAVLQWALTNKTFLDAAGLTPSLVAACTDELSRQQQ